MDFGRALAGAATLGVSEAVGYDKFKQKLFGGGATEGMSGRPEHANYMGTYLQRALRNGHDTAAPQFESADAANARAQQQTLATRLGAIANGNQAGAGELAVNRQVGQATAAQQSMANGRGQNAALLARAAGRNMSDIGVNGAGQAAIAQMNDQTMANQQLSGVLGGMRQGDIGIGQGNQQSQIQTNTLNNQAEQAYLAQLLGVDQATLMADLQKRQLAAGDQGMMPYLLQAGGSMAAGKV